MPSRRSRTGGGLTNTFAASLQVEGRGKPSDAAERRNAAPRRLALPTRPEPDVAAQLEDLRAVTHASSSVRTGRQIPLPTPTSVRINLHASSSEATSAPAGAISAETPVSPFAARDVSGARPDIASVSDAAVAMTAEGALEALRQGGSIRRAAQAFFRMDADKTGSLSAPEVQAALRMQHIALDEVETQRLIDLVDTDRSGTLSINEFLQYCHSSVGSAPKARAARLAPPPATASHKDNVHDVVRSGSAAVEKLGQAAEAQPELMTLLPTKKRDLIQFFAAIDKDQDEFISKSELREYLRRGLLRSMRAHALDARAISATHRARVQEGFGLVHHRNDPGAAHQAALKEELPFDAAVDVVVDMCDTNGDGYIDMADMGAVLDALHSDTKIPPCMPGGLAARRRSAADDQDPGVRAEPSHVAAIDDSALGGPTPAALRSPIDAHTSLEVGSDPSRREGSAGIMDSGRQVKSALWPPHLHVGATHSNEAAGLATPTFDAGATMRSRKHEPADVFHPVAARKLSAGACVPHWKLRTESIVVPSADAPCFAPPSSRFRTTAQEALSSTTGTIPKHLDPERTSRNVDARSMRLKRIEDAYAEVHTREQERQDAHLRRGPFKGDKDTVAEYFKGTLRVPSRTGKRVTALDSRPGHRSVPFALSYV